MGGANDDDIITLSKLRNTIKEKIEAIKEEQQLRAEKKKLIDDWVNIMAQSSNYNNCYDTFEIVNEKKTNYGWSFRLYAPYGLTFNSLEVTKPIIEHNMGCTFLWRVDPSNKFANCKVVYTSVIKCNNIPFVPVKVKPYEICPGVDITGEPIIIDVNASPHILIAGQTRKGKNGSADSIILSWINSCTEKEIELYLFQCAKIDLIKYKNCKQVKEFVLTDVDEMLDILNELVEKEIPKRLDLFKEMFNKRTGENIADYNKLYPNKKLSYIYVILDEFVELMIQPKQDKDRNEIKCGILSNLQRIGQMGAAVGIQYMILHQKPEKALCPTFLKNMSSVRICFGFDDESCGRIVLGDKDGSRVEGLPARRAYISNNGALELMYTTNLNNRRNMFIEPNEVKDKKSSKEIHKEKEEAKQEKKIDKEIKFEELELDIPVVDTTDKLEVDTNRIKINVDDSTDKNNSGKIRFNMFSFNSDTMSLNAIDIDDKQIEYLSYRDLGMEGNNKNDIDIKNKETKIGGEEIEQFTYEEANIDDIQAEIDKIVEINSKKIANWVPYEPKEGDKVIDKNTIEESKYYLGHRDRGVK